MAVVGFGWRAMVSEARTPNARSSAARIAPRRISVEPFVAVGLGCEGVKQGATTSEDGLGFDTIGSPEEVALGQACKPAPQLLPIRFALFELGHVPSGIRIDGLSQRPQFSGPLARTHGVPADRESASLGQFGACVRF